MAAPTSIASSRFSFDSWDENRVLDEDGVLLVHTRFKKRFTGDLDGTSIGEMMMLHTGGKPAAYTGFERVVGCLQGRSGSFVLVHSASAGLEGGLSITVVPGSGAGELSGLNGTAKIEVSGQVGDTTAPHNMILEYGLSQRHEAST